ncbi:MAG: DUF5690 family protein [Bacteroidota bacterium]
MAQTNALTTWLDRNRGILFTVYATLTAFCVYACMYAFRKPFTAAAFSGLSLWGVELKTMLIIAQVLGYTTSKFLGIKYVSEMPAQRRAMTIVGLILAAEVALFFFWVVPGPSKLVFLFLNGLPLGMVWGLVFSFLEGRRNTELLGAGLSVSFIVSSGFVKSVGRYLTLEFGLSDFAMPFFTGLLFLLPLILFTWLLNLLPPPSEADETQRTRRIPMSGAERLDFFKRFAGGIIVLTVVYMALTAFRDLRDNYALEILEAVGFVNDASIFTKVEGPVGLIVLVVMGSLMLIKHNQRALMVNHYIIAFGLTLIGGATFAFQSGWIPAYLWMVLTGLGSYLGYVPFNCILFDRLIATYKTLANAGFLIYVADSFGYLSSVGLLLYKNFGQADISWYTFFVQLCYITAGIGVTLTMVSMLYFRQQHAKQLTNHHPSEPIH